MKKITILILVLFPILILQAQQIQAFDGDILETDWVDYWCSGEGYVHFSYDSTLAGHEGVAALKCEWKLDVVDYGGGCSFAYKVNPGENIDISSADTLTLWYYIEKPMTFEYKDSIAFSIILLDNPDQADYDANGTVEQWGFDAYGVYDNTVGWHEIFIPLEESDDRTTGLMMQNDSFNSQFDPDAIKGYYLEWGTWGTALVDIEGNIVDSGTVYFDNMVLGVVTDVNEKTINSMPVKYELTQNYPNPFNPNTNIQYSIYSDGYVSLEVYNLLGEKVKTLVDKQKSSGVYNVRFDASNLNSGIYYYQIKAGNFVKTKKMILLK